uniref:Uncharacterized protein n=1 Tax=Romanomermis culicivorax TaxID=13658 RepID=A0A915I2V2_ROMCU
MDRQQVETLNLKIHFRSERTSAISWKTTDGNLQPNGTKISLSFGNVVSLVFRSVEKGKRTYPPKNLESGKTTEEFRKKYPPSAKHIRPLDLDLKRVDSQVSKCQKLDDSV